MSRHGSPGQLPVHSVMTRDVVVARPDSGVRDVAELMEALRLRLVPVIDRGERVVGVVAVSDIAGPGRGRLRNPRAGGSGWWSRRRISVTVAEVMTAPAVTVGLDAGVATAARTMTAHGVRATPVVDAHHQLRGIVTRSDLVGALIRADDDIAAEVTGVLRRYVPSVANEIGTVVDDGKVTLTGSPRARWMIPLALHLVRSVAGVATVEDRFGLDSQDTDESPWWTSSVQRTVESVDSRTP